MANLVLAIMVALDGFLGGSISDRPSVGEGLNPDAKDLQFAHKLLVLILLFAGGVKVVLPVGTLTEHIPVPGTWVRFMGVAEVLGAMFLARLLRIRLA
jgi:hypothetical protein